MSVVPLSALLPAHLDGDTCVAVDLALLAWRMGFLQFPRPACEASFWRWSGSQYRYQCASA